MAVSAAARRLREIGLRGGIDFDTACTKRNAVAKPIGRPDALVVPWHGRLYCNPPYSDVSPWIEKCFTIERGAKAALLIPSPNGEAHYLELIRRAFEVHIIGRIAFLNEHGEPITGNPRGSSFFFFGCGRVGRRHVISRDELYA